MKPEFIDRQSGLEMGIDADATIAERFTTLEILRNITQTSYDERWENVQRAYQDRWLARAMMEGIAPAIVIFLASVIAAYNQAPSAFLIVIAAIWIGASAVTVLYLPGQPWASGKYSTPKAASLASILLPLPMGIGWGALFYVFMTQMPADWLLVTTLIVAGVTFVFGLTMSAYPVAVLLISSVMVSGFLIGIWQANMANFWEAAALCAVQMVVMNFQYTKLSMEALNRVKAGADLRASEAERVAALERENEAARTAQQELFGVREQERLAAEEQRKQDLVALADKFEASVGRVAQGVAAAAGQLNESARNMAETSTRSLEQIEVLAASMEQVASGASTAAAATDEFALSVAEISRQATDSAQVARLAKQATETTDVTVGELSQKADNIGAIAELIGTIAGRTRILALNASIEAARGGQAGRGFSVVATEVNGLAVETSNATSDASARITEMQEKAGTSVSELQSISKQIHKLEAAAASIAVAVDQQSIAGKEIAMNVDLAANSAQSVSNSSQELKAAAIGAGAVAEQVLGASGDLLDQIKQLESEVGSFLSQVRGDLREVPVES